MHEQLVVQKQASGAEQIGSVRGWWWEHYADYLSPNPHHMISRPASRVFFALALLATVPLIAQAQEKVKVKVKTSSDTKAITKDPGPWSFVPSGENSFIAWRFRQGTTMLPTISRLEAYSADKLTLLGSQEPVNKVDGMDLISEDLLWIGGKAMVLGTARDPKAGTVRVYATLLDPTLSKPAQAPKELCELNGLEVKGLGSVWLQGNRATVSFDVEESADGRHFALISPRLEDKEHSGKSYYYVAVFNADLRNIWQDVVTVDADFCPTGLSSRMLDRTGTVHLAFSMLPGSATGKDRKDKMGELHVYSASSSGVKLSRLTADGSSVHATSIVELSNGEAFVVATVGAKLNQIDGLLYSRSSKPGEGFSNAERLPLEAIGDARNIHLLDLLASNDGGVYAVTEVYKSVELHSAYPNYGDIRVHCFDGAGKPKWNHVFRSMTVYDNPSVGWRRPMVRENTLHLFMVDTDKLKEKRKSGKAPGRGDMGNPYPVCVSFDPATGDPSVRTLMKSEKGQEYLSSSLVKFNNDRYITFAENSMVGSKNLPAMIEFSVEPPK